MFCIYVGTTGKETDPKGKGGLAQGIYIYMCVGVSYEFDSIYWRQGYRYERLPRSNAATDVRSVSSFSWDRLRGFRTKTNLSCSDSYIAEDDTAFGTIATAGFSLPLRGAGDCAAAFGCCVVVAVVDVSVFFVRTVLSVVSFLFLFFVGGSSFFFVLEEDAEKKLMIEDCCLGLLALLSPAVLWPVLAVAATVFAFFVTGSSSFRSMLFISFILLCLFLVSVVISSLLI